MNLKTKMAICMALVFVFFTFALGVALTGMQNTKSRFETFLEQDEALLRAATNLYAQGLQMELALRNLVLAPNDETPYKNIQIAGDEFKKTSESALALSGLSPDNRKILTEVTAIRDRQIPLHAKIISTVKDNQANATEMLTREETPLWRDMRTRLLGVIKAKNEEVKAIKAETLKTAHLMLVVSLLLGSLAVIVGGAVAFWLVRNVMKQLGGEPHYAVDIAKRIASGDLTVTIETREDDRDSLLHAMKIMLGSLATLVREVHVGAEAIAGATSEIASGAMNLSSRTEQQAGSLEETASSMEELTSTVRQNADNARQANALVGSASDVASQGGAVVSQVIETMGSINESAKKIVDIISVIDGIAFQTNILALNAAVEAARAGEQGRGFAVVAGEVRNLAQRSASAAKEIKALISNSVEKVDTGTRLVDQAGTTMSEVVASVKRVADIINDIAAASQEQTSGIEQINMAITQMDGVTQQNSALVEEAAAAADSLQEQAAKLAKLVNVFKLDGLQAATPIARPAVSDSAGAMAGAKKASPPRIAQMRSAGVPTPVRPLAVKSAVTSGSDWEEF